MENKYFFSNLKDISSNSKNKNLTFNWFIIFILVFCFLFSAKAVSQSANNNCANAISLTLGTSCSTTGFTFTNNTIQSTIDPALCNGVSANKDGWYTITAGPATTNITVTATTGRPWSLSVYSGNCSGFSLIACNNESSDNSISLSFATTPGTTYYIRINRTNGGTNAWTGTVCAYDSTPITPPANDNCSTAIPLTVNTSCSYTTYTNRGATASTGVPAPGCGGYSGGDVWFSAVVPANGILNVDTQTGVITDSGMAFYTGTCGSLSLLGCSDDESDNGAMSYLSRSGLTPGTTIYIRVWEFNNDNNGTFGICASTFPSCVPPTNQPTALNFTTITSTSISGSFTASVPASNKYLVIRSTSATAPSPAPVNGTTYAIGNTVGGGTVIAISNSTTFTTSGLTPSQPYYFYIYAYNDTSCSGGAAYNIVTPLTNSTSTLTPPINDECSGAITLTVSTSCNYTTYTNLNATASIGAPAPTCSNYGGSDVWFKAVVPANGILTLDTQTGVILDSGMELYSGNCSSLVLIECDDDDSANGNMSYITRTGLTPGSTVYIRIWEYANDNNGTFGICASTVGPCAAPVAQPTALNFPTVTTTSISGSFTAAVPTANKYLVIRSTSATPPSPAPVNGTSYAVGNTVGGGTVISTGAATTFTTAGLTPGQQYYFYVYAFNDSSCTGGAAYNIVTPLSNNTTTLSPPSNSICSTAATLPCGTSNLTATTTGAISASHGTACNMGSVGIWFTFTGDGNQTSISTKATSGWDHEMSVNSGSCGSFVNLACRDNAGNNGTETYTFTTVAGVNYYIYVSDYATSGTTTGTFLISRTCSTPPPAMTNDNCATAIDLTINSTCNYSYFTNAGATNSPGITAPGCANYSGGDIWFKVVVPANGIIYVDTIEGVMTDGGMAFYNGTCGSLFLMECDNNDSTNGDMPFISRTGLTPGQTIFIRMWENGNNNNGTFGICVTSPVSCSTGTGTGTTSLPCPAVISGGLTLNGADPAPINACVTSTCVDLEATFLPLAETTSYSVTSIPYSSIPYQFGCLRNPVSVNTDDVWSPIVTLPFNFCFYGNNYNQCLIGSNGVLTFDMANNTPEGSSAWSFNNVLPSASLFRNTIFGVYHDIDPSKGGEVGYELITLNTGCRALVVSWNNIPMFSSTCSASLYTGMMVLYENTNVIEVYVKEKNICSSWNGGNALIGIQNSSGTAAAFPNSRNNITTDWTANSEAWRFTPSGNPITPSIVWYNSYTGAVVGNTAAINVCPTTTTDYVVEVTYQLCSGPHMEADLTTVTVQESKTWDGSLSNNWNDDDNWTPPGKPNASDCVTIPVTARNPVVSGPAVALAGTLSVLNNAALTINTNQNISVTDWVNVQTNGSFQIENNASLVQINNVANTGNIVYKRNANVRKLDYVYWSSPVADYNINNISFPLAPGPIYKWNATVVNPNGGQGNWESASGEIMERAKGYIVRAPYGFSDTTPTTLNGLFTGVPHNGNMAYTISRGNYISTPYPGNNGTEINNFSDNFNLIGNPYPSAIRASQFLFDNKTKIEGNINVWTHGALPVIMNSPFYDTFQYNYNTNDYLTFNFTGTNCCPTAASDYFVGAAQGFFVQMKDGPTGTDTVVFNNGLRSPTYGNSVFYRTSNQQPVSNTLIDIERNRIWLDIIAPNNTSDRTLVGYIEGATMEKDSFFDALEVINGAVTIYSLIDHEKLTIQGRALPFNENDTVPIGVAIPANGIYKIGIAAIDGLFENFQQNIYLEDTFTGIIHNLREAPYTFEAIAGNFTDRFILRYTDSALSIQDVSENMGLAAYINNEILFINALKEIDFIEIYDVSGKLIKSYHPQEKNKRFNSAFIFPDGIYLAKIKLDNGMIFTRKLMNHR